MKRLIKFLARISGAQKEIRGEVVSKIANQLKDDAFWFSRVEEIKVYNALNLYADRMKQQKHLPDVALIRDRVRELGDRRINGHKEDCEWFLPDSVTSSATKCQRCGKEKWEHSIN